MSERDSLSTTLLASVESSVGEALEDIEDQARDLQDDQTIQVSVGPFGVFGIGTPINIRNASAVSNTDRPTEYQNPLPTPAGPKPLEAQRTSMIVAEDHGQEFRSSESNFVQEPASFDFSMVDFEGWQDLFSSSLAFLQWNDLFTADVFQESFSVPPGHSTTTDGSEWSPFQCFMADSRILAIAPETTFGSTLESPGWQQLGLDPDIPMLLQHFDDKVVNQMGALPINEKSAWRILNYPSAVVTLAKLTAAPDVKQNTTHACLSNFFAVVAVSAFHVAVNPGASPNLARQGNHWASLSDQMYKKAKHHIRESLASETEAPSKAKYKDQLMAIAAILATAVSTQAHPWHNQRTSNRSFCSSSPQTRLMLGGIS